MWNKGKIRGPEAGLTIIELTVGLAIASILVALTSGILIRQAKLMFAFDGSNALGDARRYYAGLVNNREIEKATVERNLPLRNHVAGGFPVAPGSLRPLTVYSSTGKILLRNPTCLDIKAKAVNCSASSAYMRVTANWLALADSSYELKIDTSLINAQSTARNNTLTEIEADFKFSHSIRRRDIPFNCTTASGPRVTGPCRVNYDPAIANPCLPESPVPGFPSEKVWTEDSKVRSIVNCPSSHPYIVSVESLPGCGRRDSRAKILSMSRGECSMAVGAANGFCAGQDTALISCDAVCCKAPGEIQ